MVQEMRGKEVFAIPWYEGNILRTWKKKARSGPWTSLQAPTAYSKDTSPLAQRLINNFDADQGSG